MMKEAMFYKSLAKNQVQCILCPRNCIIPEGKTGNCGARKNSGGKLYSIVYGTLASVAIDPVEKKPLFHFAPGTQTFSIATVGCNFHCRFCQNFDISQAKEISGKNIAPEEVVARARINSQGISYTYTEPTVFYEFALDTAKLANEVGLYNVLVTNGYINPEPLKKIAPYIDAANVDVKSMDDAFHQKLCGVPNVAPVLEAVRLMHKLKIHVEVTNLVIPGQNDSEKNFRDISQWLSGIDKKIPLHFSRYFPAYLMSEPPTPVNSLISARNIAKRYLHYVYVGNVGSHGLEDTYCPFCGAGIIKRGGFNIIENRVLGGSCPECGKKVLIRGIEYLK